MKKRAQAAIEYLLVGAMVTLVILPTIYIFYAYSQTSNEEIRQSQLNKVGTDIVDIAEQVYYLGESSKVTIDAAMPKGIIGIEVWENQEVVFFLQDGSEIAFMSKVNITTNQHCIGRCYGNFTETFHSPGLKSIIIEAKKDHVFIREAGDNQTEQTEIEEELIYCDNDEDTYFSEQESESCDQPWIPSSPDPGPDCDDSDFDIKPGVDEECDGKDNNCDGFTDEGFDEDDCEEKCSHTWLGDYGSLSCCGDDTFEDSPYESSEETCDDGNDNDCNDAVDCNDSNCEGRICNAYLESKCVEGVCKPTIEDCVTSQDDDEDGLTNCEDIEDCSLETTCDDDGRVCQENVYGGRECMFSPYPPSPSSSPCVDLDEDGYGVCPNCNIPNNCTHNGNDSCDDDPLVYPGAEYQYIISACGTWDYNCSGEIEKFGEDGSESIEVIGCTTTMPTGISGWVELVSHECGVYYTQRYCINYNNSDCTGKKHAFYYQPCYDAPNNCGDKYGICFTPQSWKVVEQSAGVVNY